MDCNYLKINRDKTESIIVKPSGRVHPQYIDSLNIKFDDHNIVESQAVSILGSQFDHTLSFKLFINKKRQACSYHLRNFFHIRKNLPLKTRVLLVNNFILSKLDYCNSLLATATQNDLKPLQKTLNAAARFIFNIKWNEHVSPYLKKLHFLPIKYRIIFKLCLIAYKIKSCTAPPYLLSQYVFYTPTTPFELRTGPGRDTLMLFPAEMKTFPNASIFSKIMQHWNKLPFNIRVLDCQVQFKKRLKTYLFQIAFD